MIMRQASFAQNRKVAEYQGALIFNLLMPIFAVCISINGPLRITTMGSCSLGSAEELDDSFT